MKSLNSFLVFIAKIDGARNVNDFRSVSLVSCIYKLIAKVLTRRMVKVLDKIIDNC